MSVKDRIKLFCKAEGITITAFESSIGASNGYVNAITKSIGLDKLYLLLEKYPNINLEWLLAGKGEMLKTDLVSQCNSVEQMPIIGRGDSNISEINQFSDLQNIPTRPRIPLDAAAGSLSIALSSVSESDCEQIPVIPTLPKYDFTIVARGDSMTPDILSGDELACQFINEKGFIQWGRTHVLDTAQGVVVKRIFDGNDNIVCRSSNPNYPDFLIAKTEIYHLALVVGLVRQI